MTCLDAVRIVLREAGKPLHYKQIAELVQKRGLVRIRGRRPDRSVNARLSADIIKKGDDSPFVRVAAGLFGLRERGDASVLHHFDSLVKDLREAIESGYRDVSARLDEDRDLLRLRGDPEFEALVERARAGRG